jgi:hypothetical protein
MGIQARIYWVPWSTLKMRSADLGIAPRRQGAENSKKNRIRILIGEGDGHVRPRN